MLFKSSGTSIKVKKSRWASFNLVKNGTKDLGRLILGASKEKKESNTSLMDKFTFYQRKMMETRKLPFSNDGKIVTSKVIDQIQNYNPFFF